MKIILKNKALGRQNDSDLLLSDENIKSVNIIGLKAGDREIEVCLSDLYDAVKVFYDKQIAIRDGCRH